MMATNSYIGKTLNDLVETCCHKFASRPALGMAFEKAITYKELFEKILQLAAILKDSGVKKKDKIAILAENSPNWAIAYLATVRLGAIVVPILPDFPEADVRHILTDVKAKILFTTQRQIDKTYEMERHHLKTVITLDDSHPAEELGTSETFSSFLAKITTIKQKAIDEVDKFPDVDSEDLAAIIYTSGTSGHSKSVMLSHKNLYANVCAADQLLEIPAEWTFLSILPMSHTYEFTIGFLLAIANGTRIVYAGKSPTPTILQRICKKEQPSAMCVVPMVMEKIYKKRVLTAIDQNTLLKLAIKIPVLKKKIYKKIGAKLLDFFGGKLELLAIGGAAINIEAETFLKESDFPYLIGYGLTESAPLLAGGPFKDPTIAIGSTGKPIPGVEIKIDKPDPVSGIGEILARGPNIMQGYYNHPDLTQATIAKEGWLSTGDLGSFDEQGNLHIKGRSKSVIVLANGENVYPEAVEEKINSSMHVVESLLLERNNKLEAQVYLDYDLIDQKTKNKSPQEKKEYIAHVMKDIQQKVNEQLPSYSKIMKMSERQEPFIKTATHKIKRYLYAN